MFSQQIQKELEIINSLLRSEEYSYEMAEVLSAGNDADQKELINTSDAKGLVTWSVENEKIATSIAAFYALECGVGLLCEQTSATPVEWLKKITNKTADAPAMLLLTRFANATWKAGQPFRGLGRITRYNFIGASFLAEKEIKKDNDQVSSAAVKLLQKMQQVENSSLPEQMQLMKALLQDAGFARQMAEYLDSCYHADLHLPAHTFLTPADETTMIYKNAGQQKVATSIAGFYALECGMNYLVTTKALVPTQILRSIVDNSIDDDDEKCLLRFANATWKAGQPFRDIKRITRQTFTPAYFLTKEDIEKDRYQIKTAARKLLQTIEATSTHTDR